MRGRVSSNRQSASAFGSRESALLLAMFVTMASVYVASRLWQDASNRLRLVEQLDKRADQGYSAVSVDDTLKIIACREQQKKLAAIEMDLAAARQAGFVSKLPTVKDKSQSKKKLLAVIGIITTFGHKRNRDAVRKAWMPTGAALKELEDGKGIVVRFVIGRRFLLLHLCQRVDILTILCFLKLVCTVCCSANHGNSLDREIDKENRQTNDFIILDGQVEATEENPKKIKLFFIRAFENWDAEFYAKVNDDVYVNVDALGATLSTHLDKPRTYIGCMKSGEVFSEPYFRHASGEIYAISWALAEFICINRPILHTYAHDDVSAGSWFIGLDVKHVDEGKFCCSSWSTDTLHLV